MRDARALQSRDSGAQRRLVADDADISRIGCSLAIEHRAIRRQLAVDREDLVGDVAGAGGIRGESKRQRGDYARRGATRVLRGLVDRRHRVIGERLRAGHPGGGAIGESSRDFQHLRTERRNDHRQRRPTRTVQRAIHAVQVALERDRLALRERHQHFEVLAHLLGRLRVRKPEHVLDHDLVREPNAEHEAALARGLRGQRLLRDREWMTWRRGRNAGRQLDARRLASRDRQHRDRVVAKNIGQRVKIEALGLHSLHLGNEVIERSTRVPDDDPGFPTITEPIPTFMYFSRVALGTLVARVASGTVVAERSGPGAARCPGIPATNVPEATRATNVPESNEATCGTGGGVRALRRRWRRGGLRRRFRRVRGRGSSVS
ncbi:MAG: hypothetical protein NTZ61_06885 [Proteobacteria bacterium]|nr:hypothetical protein [Pseudomonadota bacterium]